MEGERSMWTSRLLGAAALALAPTWNASATGEEGRMAPRDLVAVYAESLGIALTEAPAPRRENEGLVLAAAPVPAEELADLRGGYAMPGGLSVAFGFDIESRVGGAIVQRLTLPQTTLGHGPLPPVQVTNAQGQTSTLALDPALPTSITDVVNGGATRVMTQIGGGGIVGVLQNSRNGQVVQRTTNIGIDVSGMSGLLDNSALRSMLRSGLEGRERFGR
jgi:hypothetical protein